MARSRWTNTSDLNVRTMAQSRHTGSMKTHVSPCVPTMDGMTQPSACFVDHSNHGELEIRIKKAFAMICNGELGLRVVGRQFAIPESTLQGCLKYWKPQKEAHASQQ
ncbi:hypothetical protein M422DRAFT_261407 [Sphaerobolus stellatus SS14]|uniref:Uncharacterized protein n=1 Tax=Sphaerobolus stellatus (strain SS14) TaxID=990650 RepID=A0A0C9V3E1_SPHS4|nr:hypothetical protein M422DRAFT_261407 [Sphaerobolus stellatus SS14]